jgi:predicted nucleic acid-binding protein
LNLVVDANVIVKWYMPERDWARAQIVVQNDGLLIAPAHALGEVGHVLVQRFREGKITEDQLNLARVALPGTLLAVPLDELFDLAVEIAVRTGEAFYDALYVATAERWDTLLVTADANLAKSVSGTHWEKRVMLLDRWADSTDPGP